MDIHLSTEATLIVLTQLSSPR